ncbi:Low temperature requirement A [Kalmanozyma brasiliensis GHG001]|uniref:Uncharacterized protein n=1 Tax=Kalmanozyma brasiliensis (strain GHG001) TaxID=1365824 RepID=V5GQM8_KALBG|nr:Low temperature requirement A [Kalmanozyma brasiliensis GHG001]EST08252.1 Low temperature requirement A [Kalmanozyma brasiliensis GHG001]
MAILGSHQESHAPSYSDLLFDLLFAACLNTYSNAVSLEKFGDVAAFTGYFAALWWAWWSQAYFDVRYRRPSHSHPFLFKSSQRIIRAAVLGLWVGFSTTPSEFSRASFTNFTLIYGASRIALAVDYAVVLVYDLVRWRKVRRVGTVAHGKSQVSPSEELDEIPSQHSGQHGRPTGNISGIIRTHLISIAALVASGLLWICSRFLRHRGIRAPVLVMWILGVGIEAAAQIFNEMGGALSPLGESVLAERLVLFGLIILGEGFTGISETLNRISPGAKLRNDTLGGPSIESGGWSGDTVLQAVSCVLIVVLQFGGYFHRATSQIDMRSVLIVLWAYIHVVLHMASALLVIGLKKILAFMNTLNAFGRFIDYPALYLSNSTESQNITSALASQADDSDGSDLLSNNTALAGVASIMAVIQSNDGASIPTVEQARALVASVVGLSGGLDRAKALMAEANVTNANNALSSQFATSLVLPFKSYFEFADNVINPDSINQYIVKSLFQFKYIYVASAVYLTTDIVIKTMQSGANRRLRSFRLAMVVRFAFAIVLVLLQVVFTEFDGAPSDAALDGALAICAAVLLAELLAQQVVDACRARLDRPRPAKARSPWRSLGFGKSSHGQSRSSSPESNTDKAGEEIIEMTPHHELDTTQNRPSY